MASRGLTTSYRFPEESEVPDPDGVSVLGGHVAVIPIGSEVPGASGPQLYLSFLLYLFCLIQVLM